jgi:ATP-grasp ribosomal peptide maturase
MGVLVLAEECDPTADMVVETLVGRGARVDRLDLGWFPARLDLDADLGPDGWAGALRAGNREVSLTEVRAVFYRSPTAFAFPPQLSGPELRHVRMEAKIGLGGCLWALPGVLWMNHPARQSDLRKPDQLATASAVGLQVPRSLVTNLAAATRRFADEVDGPIVVKPLGYGSILEEDTRRAMYTRVLTEDDLSDLSGVEATAHLFQQYVVDKAYELRLTVVGNGDDARLFPAAIHAGSDAARVDFRSDYDSLSYSVVEVPDDVSAGVRAFMRSFGITLGHFDFCVDHTGAHWFLECNGSGGQYGFVEKATGLRITDSIADLLRKGAP